MKVPVTAPNATFSADDCEMGSDVSIFRFPTKFPVTTVMVSEISKVIITEDSTSYPL